MNSSDEVQAESLGILNNYFSSVGSKLFDNLKRQYNNFIHQDAAEDSSIESDLGLANFKTIAFLNRISTIKAEYFMHYRSIIDEVGYLFGEQIQDGNFESVINILMTI